MWVVDDKADGDVDVLRHVNANGSAHDNVNTTGIMDGNVAFTQILLRITMLMIMVTVLLRIMVIRMRMQMALSIFTSFVISGMLALGAHFKMNEHVPADADVYEISKFDAAVNLH